MRKRSIIDHELVKDYNRKEILMLIYKKRELTKQEIAKLLKLSIPTIISNINDLISEGIVEESGVSESTGGRKPKIVRFMADGLYSFGVDITTKSTKIILTNLDSKIIREDQFNINKLESMDKISKRVYKIINKIILEERLPKEKILGIGISVPGTVNEEKLQIEEAINLGIENFSFDKFKKDIKLPVYVENEANVAALAELNIGIAKDIGNLVYVSITEGIGAGIVIQGSLYKGKNKRAGEFGHMTIEMNGIECSCGRRGCLEVYASQKALLLNYYKSTGEDLKELSDFFTKVKNNEPRSLECLNLYLDYLSIGIMNIILQIDPKYIIIGGEISYYEEFLIDKLRIKVFKENKFFKEGEIKILFSKLKSNSSVLGASLLPLNSLFSIKDSII